ncbi:hypothetical protein SKAU_G00130630 [Synaphobranchus kaupii]|uniref:Uncharacterized protein n=1 Tax=Synaphobranchus kaupii TaxID=118154 RepID=A0A9Q1J161_SYNKA|nr:hypothetical protein SKAU_G00130630 [Synaphobranchus kaupii]
MKGTAERPKGSTWETNRPCELRGVYISDLGKLKNLFCAKAFSLKLTVRKPYPWKLLNGSANREGPPLKFKVASKTEMQKIHPKTRTPCTDNTIRKPPLFYELCRGYALQKASSEPSRGTVQILPPGNLQALVRRVRGRDRSRRASLFVAARFRAGTGESPARHASHP